MDWSRFRWRVLVFGISAGATAVLFFLYHAWSYDDPYITFRYAENFIRGAGFVYNSGEKILSTTTPLFAFLLGLGGYWWSNIPALAVLVGCLSIGISAVLIFELAGAWGHPAAGWVSILLLPTFGLLPATLSSETPLYIALALAVFYAYSTRQYTWMGLLAALLVLTRPDGALLPLMLVVHYFVWVRGPLPWKGLAVFSAVSLLGWGAIWLYFGSPIPVTLLAKQQQGVMSISQGFAQGLWTILSWYREQLFFGIEWILAVLGLGRLVRLKSPALLLVAWTLLYFASYSFLGVTRYFWYYAPLIPGFIFLVAAGIEQVHAWLGKIGRSPILAFALTAGLVSGLFFYQARHVYRQSLAPDQRIPLYKAAGEWLQENTPSQSKVAALEVGAIGYYSQRSIVDFAGLIQPEVARQMRPDSTYEDTAVYALDRFQPEYVVGFDGFMKALIARRAKNCRQVMLFHGSDFGSSQDLLIFHCSP